MSECLSAKEDSSMKRMKTSHNYHDAWIKAFEFQDKTLVLEIDHCGSYEEGSHGGATVHLFFYDVRNADEIRDHLRTASEVTRYKSYIDEILDIDKTGYREYVLYLANSGSLRIDAERWAET